MKARHKLLSVVSSCLLITSTSHAAEESFYIGAGIGKSDFSLNLPGSNKLPAGIKEDDRSTSYSLTGGYTVNPYLSVEVNWLDLGKYQLKHALGKGSAEIYGLGASAMWQLPIGEQWHLFLRTGALYAKARTELQSATESYREHHTGTVPLLGAGVSYAFSKNWSVRAEYEDIGGTSIIKSANSKVKLEDNLWSLGLTYNF